MNLDAITLLDKELGKERQELFFLVTRLCGDIQLKMCSEDLMDTYTKDYKLYSREEEVILNSTLKDIYKQSEYLSL